MLSKWLSWGVPEQQRHLCHSVWPFSSPHHQMSLEVAREFELSHGRAQSKSFSIQLSLSPTHEPGSSFDEPRMSPAWFSFEFRQHTSWQNLSSHTTFWTCIWWMQICHVQSEVSDCHTSDLWHEKRWFDLHSLALTSAFVHTWWFQRQKDEQSANKCNELFHIYRNIVFNLVHCKFTVKCPQKWRTRNRMSLKNCKTSDSLWMRNLNGRFQSTKTGLKVQTLRVSRSSPCRVLLRTKSCWVKR